MARLIGGSAFDMKRVAVELAEGAAWEGCPFFVWCDGDDVTAVIGQQGDTAQDVLKLAARCVPELAS